MDLVTNNTFWTAVATLVAATSLAVTLWPRLHDRLRGPQVHLSVGETFAVSHQLGNIQISLFVDVENSGGRGLTISKINCVLAEADASADHKQRRRWVLPAQTMIVQSSAVQPGQAFPELLVGPIHLESGAHWQQMVRCYRRLSESDEAEADRIRVGIAKSIGDKQRQMAIPYPALQARIEADPEAVDEAREFVRRLFSLPKGPYEIYVAAHGGSRPPLVVKGFTFVLYENAVSAFHEITENYRYGWGITTLPPTGAISLVLPRLKAITDDKAVRATYLALTQ